jgi:hypothetical protein
LALSAPSVTYGDEQSETLSVTVAPATGDGVPTGTVTVTSAATSVCEISLSSSGTGSCTLAATRVAPGLAQLTASYSGDATYSSSVSTAATLTVATEPTTTSLAVSATRATYGAEQRATVVVKVTPAYGGGPNGSVTLKAGSATIAVLSLKAGTARYAPQPTRLTVGTARLVVTYSGSADFGASRSAAKALVITKAATTTAVTLARTKVTYGDESAARVSVAVRPRYSGTPSGSVTVKAGTITICVIRLRSARGTCSPPAARLSAKSARLIATYSGSADFGASSSTAKTLAVAKARSTTTLILSTAKVQYGSEQAGKLSVAVSPQYSGYLTGTVAIKAGSVTVAVVALRSGKGSYTLTSKRLPAGAYTLVATYSGNADYDGSTSAGRSLRVSAPPTHVACYPLSNEGTCYEPGEFCRSSDHGAHGIAGDGKPIVCEDNNGWRWEPVS